jgi:hypothetical protein
MPCLPPIRSLPTMRIGRPACPGKMELAKQSTFVDGLDIVVGDAFVKLNLQKKSYKSAFNKGLLKMHGKITQNLNLK